MYILVLTKFLKILDICHKQLKYFFVFFLYELKLNSSEIRKFLQIPNINKFLQIPK